MLTFKVELILSAKALVGNLAYTKTANVMRMLGRAANVIRKLARATFRLIIKFFLDKTN